MIQRLRAMDSRAKIFIVMAIVLVTLAATGYLQARRDVEIEQDEDGVWHAAGTLMQDYRSVPAEFVPAMEAAGFSDELIETLMSSNPWHAFSR